MDLFAVILVTITAVTICGICTFIFVCAFQPRFLRKLHGRAIRTYQETDSTNSSNDNRDDLSVKSADLVVEITDDRPTTHVNGRDRKLYLKSLERSLRTGRRIQDPNSDEQSTETRWNFIRHCFNKYIRRKTSTTCETTDL